MCGLAGIITKTPQPFDYSTFCTLGVANDSRGGDSCGVFIDGKYEYGVNDKKLFSSYFLDSKLLYGTEKSTVALVHCRKASVGKISAETAQPVVLTDKKGKVLYVLMHNGTIHNYEELAKKYIPEVNIEGMTDSQVMARIFFHSGYNALKEYNGGAVFVIVDYREKEPVTLFFKGSSKKNQYSVESEEERPLYYSIDKDKKELVFSSIWTYIAALRKELDVYSLRPNILYKFAGNGFSKVKDYDRSKCFQTRKTLQTAYFGDWYGYNEVVYDNYITINNQTNTYSYKGEKIHGRLFLTQYGKVEKVSSKRAMEVYFFDGVAMKNSYCFRFLMVLLKETKLTRKAFSEKFQNVIRFLSIDEAYCKGGLWYKAITPTDSILFTGVIQALTATMKSTYENGALKSTTYGNGFGEMKPSKKDDINFKIVKEQCESLMK